MIKDNQIKEVLRQVENPEVRSLLESLFSKVLNPLSREPMLFGKGNNKRKSAKKALDIISRIGIEINGDDPDVSWFFEHFD